MPYTGPYDAEFTPDMERLLKHQIKWLREQCETRRRAIGPLGYHDHYDFVRLSECVRIKTAFERQLRRLRHEAKERANAKDTTP